MCSRVIHDRNLDKGKVAAHKKTFFLEKGKTSCQRNKFSTSFAGCRSLSISLAHLRACHASVPTHIARSSHNLLLPHTYGLTQRSSLAVIGLIHTPGSGGVEWQRRQQRSESTCGLMSTGSKSVTLSSLRDLRGSRWVCVFVCQCSLVCVCAYFSLSLFLSLSLRVCVFSVGVHVMVHVCYVNTCMYK